MPNGILFNYRVPAKPMFLLLLLNIAQFESNSLVTIPAGKSIIIHLPKSVMFYLAEDDEVETLYAPEGKLPQGPFVGKKIISGCLYRNLNAEVTITSRKQNSTSSSVPRIYTVYVQPNCVDNCLIESVYGRKGDFKHCDDGLIYYRPESLSTASEISVYLGTVICILYIIVSTAFCCRK